MSDNTTSAVLRALRQDEDRLKGIELMPPATHERFAPGIAKLRQRIREERAALGLLPEDTEAWAKHLLDGVDYYKSEGIARLVNQYLMLVEDAREAADPDAMHDAQRRLERLIQEISEPEQLQFGA